MRDIADFSDTDWAKIWVTTPEVSDRNGGVVTVPAPPWHFSGHDGTLNDQIAALQGEHNEEILKGLGCTDSQIPNFKDSGALISSS